MRDRHLAGFACLCLVLTGCGGGGGNDEAGPSSPPITSFELIDPTPGAGNRFGSRVIILANGNIVVTDPFDSSVAAQSGAVHLYNPVTQTRIASIYGDAASDQLGSGGVTALANGNFVIVSPSDDEGGLNSAGSVRLVSGTTGAPIGSPIVGNAANDFLGSGGVTALASGNFVIASPIDNEGGLNSAGSVRLVSGTTGAPIGSFVGDATSDQLGSGGVTALASGNFVIASPSDDEGGIVNAGSVRLVNGTTGATIGTPIVGSANLNFIGFFGVTVLANGNFVIVSPADDPSGLSEAGSVRLVNGTTGAPIGSPIAGSTAGDQLGSGGVTALANDNFVIASPNHNEGGIVDAGSVQLVNGTTGALIGSPFVGNVAQDRLGDGGVTALSSGNFVIASPNDDEGGIVNAGSVRLVNGTTGATIGSLFVGDAANDGLGSGGVTALSNGNFVIASPLDNEGGIVDAGSVRLVNGTTGATIGSLFVGDVASDQLGSGGVTALSNGNFVIASPLDNEGGIVDAGSVRLVNGTTGAPIGSLLVGDVASDQLGSGGVTALANGNFVIASPLDNEGGIVDAGSVRVMNGTTGAQIGLPVTGSVAGDINTAGVTSSAAGNFFILSFPFADKVGADSGLVRLIAP